MSSQSYCDGCEKPLERENWWHIDAIYFSNDPEYNGDELNTDLCQGCIVKMKYFRAKKK